MDKMNFEQMVNKVQLDSEMSMALSVFAALKETYKEMQKDGIKTITIEDLIYLTELCELAVTCEVKVRAEDLGVELIDFSKTNTITA